MTTQTKEISGSLSNKLFELRKEGQFKDTVTITLDESGVEGIQKILEFISEIDGKLPAKLYAGASQLNRSLINTLK